MSDELNIVLLGPPGAGKGTQADRLQKDFPKLCYISTGNMLRAAVSERSELGVEAKQYMDSGNLVPDSLVTKMAIERLQEDDAAAGVLLDGFPRNVAQAEALDEELSEQGRGVSGALVIDVEDDEIVHRISGRRICSKDSSHVYHVDYDPPKHPDRCDVDGAALIQRDDDKPEVVRERLEVYRRETEPVVSFYEDKGLLTRIDGARSPSDVHDHIRATVAAWRLEHEL